MHFLGPVLYQHFGRLAERPGRIDDVVDLRRPEFEFTASGPDVDDLTRMLGLGEEGDGDIKLSGALKPIADGPLILRVEGNLGIGRASCRERVLDGV